MTNSVVSGLNPVSWVAVFVALANGIRGYTNKVYLRGLRENKVFSNPQSKALANGIRGYTNKVHLRGLREN